MGAGLGLERRENTTDLGTGCHLLVYLLSRAPTRAAAARGRAQGVRRGRREEWGVGARPALPGRLDSQLANRDGPGIGGLASKMQSIERQACERLEEKHAIGLTLPPAAMLGGMVRMGMPRSCLRFLRRLRSRLPSTVACRRGGVKNSRLLAHVEITQTLLQLVMF